MYITILHLVKLYINNLLFLYSTIYRYGMIFMVMADLHQTIKQQIKGFHVADVLSKLIG